MRSFVSLTSLPFLKASTIENIALLSETCQLFDMIAIMTQTVNKRSTNEYSMNWLRRRREQVGIETQEELVTRLELEGFNITRGAVSHWETGRYNPPVDDPAFRDALSRVLKLSEPELLRMAGYQVTRGTHSQAAERAADILDRLTPDKQNLAIKVLEQFLGE